MFKFYMNLLKAKILAYRLDKAGALLNAHGFTVVQLIEKGGTTYIKDQSTGALRVVGKTNNGK